MHVGAIVDYFNIHAVEMLTYILTYFSNEIYVHDPNMISTKILIVRKLRKITKIIIQVFVLHIDDKRFSRLRGG